jgi:hypothetical protein
LLQDEKFIVSMQTLVTAIGELDETCVKICGAWAAETLLAAPICGTSTAQPCEHASDPRPLNTSAQVTSSRLDPSSDTQAGPDGGDGSDVIMVQQGLTCNPEPTSKLSQLHTSSAQAQKAVSGPLTVAAGTADYQIRRTPGENADEEVIASTAASCEMDSGALRKSSRGKNATVRYCTMCHPQDLQLPQGASRRKWHYCYGDAPASKRRKLGNE